MLALVGFLAVLFTEEPIPSNSRRPFSIKARLVYYVVCHLAIKLALHYVFSAIEVSGAKVFTQKRSDDMFPLDQSTDGFINLFVWKYWVYIMHFAAVENRLATLQRRMEAENTLP
jgi:hypothetical protein